MTDNALRVDATQFTVETLAAARLGRVVTELPNNLEAALPVVQVIRTGGPTDGIVLDIPTFAIHTFAKNQRAANQLAYAAVATLHAAVGEVRTVDDIPATMTRVRNLGGPTVADYPNRNLRHAVTLVQARIKLA